jgi:hypothetical protein
MKALRFSALLVLGGVLALLTPLALASPPDPSWIRGVYDDGDLDNVVMLIMSSAGVLEPSPLDKACSVPLVIALLHQTEESPVASEVLSLSYARAPPAF